MKIKKYGGSSLKNNESIMKVAKNIIEENDKQIIVVSAPYGYTNDLIKKAKEISKKPDLRELDQILVTGEMINASLLTMALLDLGKKCLSLNALSAEIKTDDNYSDGRIISINKEKITALLQDYDVLVITGFQGINGKEFVTLGRGGSDTTALALSKVFDVPCEIYTDVDGVYTVDPNEYKITKKIGIMNFEEMLELSLAGGKILSPEASQIAADNKIDTYIFKSLTKEGTLITDVEFYGPKALGVIDNISIDNISIEPLIQISTLKNEQYVNNTKTGKYTLISVVGSFLLKSKANLKIEGILDYLRIKPKLLISRENNISIIINSKRKTELINRIMEQFSL